MSDGYEFQQMPVVKVDGSALTGTAKSNLLGDSTLSDGKVDGNAISFDGCAPDCLSLQQNACNNGIDDDDDGRIDFANNDPGCTDANDESERSTNE